MAGDRHLGVSAPALLLGLAALITLVPQVRPNPDQAKQPQPGPAGTWDSAEAFPSSGHDPTAFGTTLSEMGVNVTAGSLDFAVRENGFWLGGERITLLSGSLHYWRVPPDYWTDRLVALRDMGLNAVETYVPWSLHQPRADPASISFDGALDLNRFLELARDLGLMVILRPGPYVCSELDLGGLPSWLLAQGAQLRTNNAKYLQAVDVWWDALIPRVVPHQVNRGGPIVLVQVENEFGHLRFNGTEYLLHLVGSLRRHGIEVPFVASDGMDPTQIFWGGHLGEKANETILRTVNFGDALNQRAKVAVQVLKMVQPHVPVMAMELWCGWFEAWGAHTHVSIPQDAVLTDLSDVLTAGGSFNLYMFHGGTNWGFTSGSLILPGKPQHVITSYDYDAPLSEGGERTPKYFALQAKIQEWKMQHPELGRLALPPRTGTLKNASSESGKVPLGRVVMKEWLPLLDCPGALPPAVHSEQPLSMEQLPIHGGSGQSYGMLLYRTNLSALDSIPKHIEISGMRDRAQLWLAAFPRAPAADTARTGARTNSSRSKGRSWGRETNDMPKKLPVQLTSEWEGHDLWLEVMVENLGRAFMTHNFPQHLHEHRGLESVLGLPDRAALKGWDIYPLEFDTEHIQSLLRSNCWQRFAAPGEPRESAHASDTSTDGSSVSSGAYVGGDIGSGQPVLFRGELHINASEGHPMPSDQWVDTGMMEAENGQLMWQKGVLFVNGFNIGRFWPFLGPQRTLYLPASLLKPGANELLLLEQHAVLPDSGAGREACNAGGTECATRRPPYVELLDHPLWA